MTEDHDGPTDTEDPGDGTDTDDGGDGLSLEEQLEQLKQQQAVAAAAQLDANVKDLTKLIEDAAKAQTAYEEAHQGLKDLEARLRSEEQTLGNALRAALGDAGISEIETIVTEQVDVVTAAEAARDAARDARDEAKGDAENAAQDLKDAEAELDLWRAAATTIKNRLKKAETLIEEVKKLRNANRRGEAYWKLALGDHAEVPGQEFVHAVLGSPPEVIEPAELYGRIEAAWNSFHEARTKAAEANALLAAAEADLKAQEAALSAASKNLIKSISDALAEREATPDAA